MTPSPSNYSAKKPHIAMYYPCFMGGGAEAVALWILEALKNEYDLTLYTFTDLDLDQLNVMYETTLSRESVKVISIVPQFSRNLSNFFFSQSKNYKQFVFHELLRRFKQEVSQYDLAISGYNAVDLGVKGLQYIHWVKVIEGGIAPQFYYKISNFSLERLKQNISVANSYTVAEEIEKVYGIKANVIYPPVILDNSSRSWEDKENAFICSGRLVMAKQPHKAIQILQQVRKRGFDVKLYLTGGGGGVGEWQYKRFLNKMIRENSSWVTLYENLSYRDYTKVLEKCRYGIHHKPEPFGISVAEMVKSGLIPFVRSRGGQMEIVGVDNTELLFSNEQEAAEKIIQVLENSAKQQKLLEKLSGQKNLFSTEKFQEQIRETVHNILNSKAPQISSNL